MNHILPSAQFLPTPAEIRKAINQIASASSSLQLAVAFIGPEWQRLLANYAGPIKAICWLTHPATDPDAVKSLINRNGTLVRQRTGLHTKVYLAPNVDAIVGSANLSRPALTDNPGLPQCEAGMLVTEPALVKEIGKWFNSLWNDQPQTGKITDSDLERAKKERKKWPFRAIQSVNKVPPPPDVLPPPVLKLAKQVENISLKKTVAKYHNQLRVLLAKPALSASDVSLLADSLAAWTKHRAVYKTFEKRPRQKTLQGLKMLVDEGREIYDRLRDIKQKKLLKGLQIPTMSLLLYWWRPDAYPPFNAKTEAFLKDFKMSSRGLSSSSPACYATWLAFAENLQAKLHLPSVGHVDRVVSKYYDSKKS